MASNARPTYNRRRAKRLAVAALGGFPEKRPTAGHNVSHSHRKTKRLFKPNLQKTKVLVDGKMVSIRIDAKTLRNITKVQKERSDRPKTKRAAKPAARTATKKPRPSRGAKKPAAKAQSGRASSRSAAKSGASSK